MSEYKELLKSQREYFATGHTKDIEFRIDLLNILKKNIEKYEDDISDALYKDLGKSKFESYATEIGITLSEISHITDNLKKWTRPKKVKSPLFQFPAKSYIYKEPLGVAFIISPWNYPFQLTLAPLIGAIAAGNCAILTVSQKVPNTTEILDKIIKETFNENHVKFIPGGSSVSKELLEEEFDYIFFTGSVGVGKKIMETAAKTLTPVTLELGGKSPTIVDKYADIDIAAERIVWGKFLNSGQTCIAPDYVLVQSELKEKLVEKLKYYIEKFYGENPIESNDYPRIVNEDHFNKVSKLLLNGNILHGGSTDKLDLYIEPTIMDSVTWDDEIMKQEIFGPILPILTYEGIEDAINTVNSHPKPLALYLFTDNEDVEEKVIKEVSYGGGCVNDTVLHLSSAELPFGGVGNSGMGNYHGKASFDTFTHEKSVFKNSKSFDFNFRYPPYSKTALKLIKKFLK